MAVFRFDDVSVNTDLDNLDDLLIVIRKYLQSPRIILAISPIVFGAEQLRDGNEQRVHPPVLTAMSALHPYYKGRRCGIPVLSNRPDVERAGHGIVHVDHRLLDFQSQELSIVTSCALAEAYIFVPPYNHWDANTEEICHRHGIELVKFEMGWQHVLHNKFDKGHRMWYMHPYDMTPDQLVQWFKR